MAGRKQQGSWRGNWPIRFQMRWRHLCFVVLMICLLGSAAAVVVSSHLSRGQYAQLQKLEAARDDARARWGRLLLEESAWSAPARIESISTERLEMRVPDVHDVEVIR
ncbi:cell division protein FtsL [Cobetia marina]|jgi:cell division protein FtsL|uniref:Cell division protein FtsL n=1 Tax=Cobetia marina TaxID=28258 RepID=A0ABU9GIB7_COBMA|nr:MULTISPECIES: cell division protein FtsL [Cobetia]AOM02125.1 cell division protein FtsL [Cobetia marina]AZV31958.1 cell division protein FtsL [Cobetia sp. ICG0124]MDA5563640.1 cell division protein FtsL [Cobetia sp. MMG027]MDH2290674.1 cell division protein FtsL [Cobetia sp. 10Alg 146]MDH2372601.1 cell division protein FtsL [Cobetia sp. 3AK]